MHNYPIMNKRFMHISNISNSPQTRSANVNATATANWLATAQRTQLTQFWQFVVLFHCESCRRAFNIHIQSKHTQTHRHTRKQCPGAYELSRLRPKWRSRKEKKNSPADAINQAPALEIFSLALNLSYIVYSLINCFVDVRACVCVLSVSRANDPHSFNLSIFIPKTK